MYLKITTSLYVCICVLSFLNLYDCDLHKYSKVDPVKPAPPVPAMSPSTTINNATDDDTYSNDDKNSDDCDFNLLTKFNNQRISNAAVKKKSTLRPTLPPVNSLLKYGGGDPTSGIGAVVKPQVAMVFWGSQWNTQTGNSAGADTILKNFFMNVGGSTWLHTTKEYCTGTSSGSSICSSVSSKYHFFLIIIFAFLCS